MCNAGAKSCQCIHKSPKAKFLLKERVTVDNLTEAKFHRADLENVAFL